jgi:hypothetical protein
MLLLLLARGAKNIYPHGGPIPVQSSQVHPHTLIHQDRMFHRRDILQTVPSPQIAHLATTGGSVSQHGKYGGTRGRCP